MDGNWILAAAVVLACVIFFVYFKRKRDGESIAKDNASVTKAEVVTSAPQIQAGIEEETVAAIMAAVSCMMGSGAQYAVKSITRAKGERPAWCVAGMMHNTRPF